MSKINAIENNNTNATDNQTSPLQLEQGNGTNSTEPPVLMIPTNMTAINETNKEFALKEEAENKDLESMVSDIASSDGKGGES